MRGLLVFAACIVSVVLVFVLPRRAKLAACAIASLSIGLLLGMVHAGTVHASAHEWDGLDGGRVQLRLLEDSAARSYYEAALVEARAEGHGAAVLKARFPSGTTLYCGDLLEGVASFSRIDYEDNAFAWSEGSCGILKVSRWEYAEGGNLLTSLCDVRKEVIEGIGATDDDHALLQALACGYRRSVEQTELYGRFQTSGLAHMVAVSGAHLVIVTGLFGALLDMFRVSRRIKVVCLVMVMGAYYVLAGMPVSALRACIMSTVGMFAYFGRRRPSSLNAVGVGLFGIITASPSASVSVSLALSALSTMGIVVFAPLVNAWLSRSPLRAVPIVSDALSLTLSAGLMSQCYASSLFHVLPFVSPLANVCCAPLFPIVCSAGFVAGLSTLAFGPNPIVGCAATLSHVLACAVEWLARVPYAAVPFAFDASAALCVTAMLALALWLWWPHPRIKSLLAGCAALVFALSMPAMVHDPSDKIVMLDVGQGDAILIESAGRTMLVDTGNQDSKLLEQLGVNQIAHLDCVLITHADEDHCGSLDALQKAVEVDRVLVAQDMQSCLDESARELMRQAGMTADDVIGLRYGDSFALGAFTVNVIWPHSFAEDGGNADSVCMLIGYDGNGDGAIDIRALLTGDAEKEEVAAMIDEGSLGRVDILKVGHHGSRNGLTVDEARVLKPRIALISCGLHNRYGHPAEETLALFDELSTAVYRTDLNGEVRCKLSSAGISVSCIE